MVRQRDWCETLDSAERAVTPGGRETGGSESRKYRSRSGGTRRDNIGDTGAQVNPLPHSLSVLGGYYGILKVRIQRLSFPFSITTAPPVLTGVTGGLRHGYSVTPV